MHANLKAETWTLRVARAIAAVARHQDRRGVLVLEVPRICRDSESSFIEVAGLAAEPRIRFRAWVDPKDTPGIVATRELVPRPTMHDVSFCFHSDLGRTLQRVVRRARRYYRAVGGDPALDAWPPVLEVGGDEGVVEFGAFFGVPATDRAPNPLTVVDVAFFLLQVGRLHAGLRPLAASLDNYSQRSPGKLVAIPDGEHVLSRFLCPDCGRRLWSTDVACESCEWDLYARCARPYTSPYDHEFDGN